MSKAFPGRKLVAVTPSDSTVYSPPLRALWVGTAGALALVAADDSASVTVPNVSGLFPVETKQVLSTGTTASGIVGIY